MKTTVPGTGRGEKKKTPEEPAESDRTTCRSGPGLKSGNRHARLVEHQKSQEKQVLGQASEQLFLSLVRGRRRHTRLSRRD